MTAQVNDAIAYHERRALQERSCAVHAIDRQARRAHAMLSKLHEMMRYDLTK